MTALSLSFQMIALIAIGFFTQRMGLVGEEFDKSVTSFLLNISLPCMIVRSLSGTDAPDKLRQCGVLLALSVLITVLSFAVGQVLYLAAGRDASARILRFGTIFTNFTFVGIPVVEALYGEAGLFAFLVFVVPFRLAYYTSAKPLLSPPGFRREKQSLPKRIRAWLSPPVSAALVGLFLYLTQIKLPGPVNGVLSSVGSVCSPMGMILCGLSLAKYDVRTMLSVRYLRVPMVRNLVMPALTVLLMLALPVDAVTQKMVTIFAALPVASLLAAFTIQYDPAPASKQESAASVFFSTLFSAVTIPFWAWVAELVF